MKARELKGVYNLNPTKMIMKQGSKASRAAMSQNKKTTKPKTPKGK